MPEGTINGSPEVRSPEHVPGLSSNSLWNRRHFVLRALNRLPAFVRIPANSAMIVVYLFLNYLYDYRRFLRWSGVIDCRKYQITLQAQIMIDYHRLEKALALKHPRTGFSKKIVQDLLSNLQTYLQRYGVDDTVRIALNTLLAYQCFQESFDLGDPSIRDAVDSLRQTASEHGPLGDEGGTLLVTRQQIQDAAMRDLSGFFERRYSIRQYEGGEVDSHLIAQAVRMAQKTPSVCNRQSTRVYLFNDPKDKAILLRHQGGSRGFGEQVSTVLIIASDRRNFVTAGERNQCWVDGGMFAMSLVYALHSLGLGTCCLNWSVDKFQDIALRRDIGLQDADAIIMMLAVGNLPEQLRVAQSTRRPLHEVMIVPVTKTVTKADHPIGDTTGSHRST